MKISINGNYVASTQADELFRKIDQNTYDSLGQAISDKINTAIHNTDWYNYKPPVANNFKDLHAICGNDAACYMDNANWQIMNKTEVTADIYKFITHRVHVVKDGFAHNFWPWDQVHQALNFIDWHFVLDCISWFI